MRIVPKNQRREKIISIACDMAEMTHYQHIRRDQLASALGYSSGVVTNAIGSVDQLRDDVVQFAIENRRHRVIAQAVIDRHPSVARLPHEARVESLMMQA